jgi:hypothetical protein
MAELLGVASPPEQPEPAPLSLASLMRRRS